MQHNTAGITLSNFIGNAGGNNGVFTFAIVIDQQAAIARRPLINCACVSLSTKNLLNEIAVSEVKTNIAIGNGDSVHFNELLHLGFIFFRQRRLFLLFAKLFITSKLCLFIFFYRRPSFTRLNARFFRRSLDLRRFFAGDAALSNCSCKVSFAIFVSKPAEEL